MLLELWLLVLLVFFLDFIDMLLLFVNLKLFFLLDDLVLKLLCFDEE